MKILELFSGTESFGKVARAMGHEVFTIDCNEKFKPSLCKDMLDVTINDIPFKPDVIWASPPCTAFSVACIGRNWDKETRQPKTIGALVGIELVKKTLKLIAEIQPKYWIIENPRGMLRKMDIMPNHNRTSVSYCQYGDTRMKPTDIWNNFGFIGKICKNGASCHISEPRGSRTGTQGLKGNMERSVIPPRLCEEILIIIENNLSSI